MRKFTAFVLALVCVLGLVGCSSNNIDATKPVFETENGQIGDIGTENAVHALLPGITENMEGSYAQFNLTFPTDGKEKTEHNFDVFEITPFEIQFLLPEGWSIGNYDPQAVSYLYNGAWSRVGVYGADGVCVGAVGYNTYIASEVVEGEPMSIYHQVALGNDYQFNVRETYTVIKETDQCQTATTDVYYAPGFAGKQTGKDGSVNYGILSHSFERAVYVAFEFDHKALTDEQIVQIADSVEFT